MYSRRYEVGLVALLFVGWGAVYLDRMALPFLSPYIKPDLRLNDAQIGNLNAAVALGWAASTFLMGALSDRVGRKPVLVPALFATAFLSVLSGLVATYSTLLVIRGLLGVAEGPIWATLAALVSESSAPKTRSANVAIVLSAASVIGLAIAPVLLTQIASHYTWHVAFFVAGGPVLLVAILVLFYAREPGAHGGVQEHPKPTLTDFRLMALSPNLWICALGAGAFLGWLYLLNGFGPLYIAEGMHRDPRVAGLVMGSSGLGGVVMGLLMVWWSGRIGRKPAALIMSVLAVAAPLLLLARSLYEPIWLLAALEFLFTCSIGITTLLLVIAAAESVPPNTAAAAIGAVSMAGEVIGATTMPAIGGRLAISYGLKAPLLLAALSAALLAVAVSVLRFHRRHPRRALSRGSLTSSQGSILPAQALRCARDSSSSRAIGPPIMLGGAANYQLGGNN
jgi:sugar phosphate permease